MKTSYSKGYKAIMAFIFLLGISISSAQTELRINTGGSASTYQGENFMADQYANTGTTLNRPQTGLPQPFQSFRFSRSQQLSYNIPLSDGVYTVKLYFAELWFGATGGGSGGAGSRIFDVTIEGQLAEDNLDIFSEVGADAMLVKTHSVSVSGGVLNIDFDSRDQVGGERHPVINGIEIVSNNNNSEINIQAIADQFNEINENVSFTASATGGDANIGFVFSMQGAPAGISINQSTGLISGTIDDHAAHHGSSNDGNYQVTVTASKGADSASTSYNWMITDPSCAWNTLADANIERFEAISQKIGDKLYVLGGFKPGVLVVPETEIYDTTNDTWSIGASMPIPVTHTAAVAVGSEIWILGGFAGDNPGVAVKAVQIYNSQTDSWSMGPDLPNLVGSGAGALSGNKIHFFGGLMPDRQTDVADHWVLDLTNIASGWTAAAPMPNARNHHSGISVNGIVYAIGGQVGHDGPKYDTKFVHAYNPNTDTWMRLTDLDRTRSHFKAATTLHNGKIIIAGGIDNGPIVNDISVFDPQLNSWSELCKLPGDGLEEAAAQAFGDRLIVSGGRPIQDSNTIIKETKWIPLEADNTSQSPIANAGNDKTINLPTDSVILNGTGSDPDGGTVTYFWNQVSGPNTAQLSNTTDVNLSASGLVEGNYVFRLTVTDDENESSFDEVSATVNGEVVVPDFALRINAGGPEIMWSGNTFLADQYRTGGHIYTVDFPINETTNDELYQTEIYGPSVGPFTYEIPVPESGEYTIRLHFAELYFGIQAGGVGSRVFNVSVEGSQVISNLDMLTEAAPATAIIKEFNDIQITDGFATIAFTGVTQRAKISAIEVLSLNDEVVAANARVNALFIQGGYQFEDETIMTDNLQFGTDEQSDYPAINISAAVSEETSKVYFKFTQVDSDYIYEHTDNAVPFNTDTSAIGQNDGIPTAPGRYLLEVVPFNGDNEAGETVRINYETFSQCAVYFEDLVIETSDASCETSSDGTAYIDGSYSFDENSTGFVYDSSIDKYKNENLAPGLYSVTLVNSPNCSETIDFVIHSLSNCEEPNPEDIWLEAECATVGSNWSFVNDSAASNGQYVLPPVGFSSSGSNNADNIVKFDFNASQGVYKIYALVKTPTSNQDSFYVRVNGGAWKRWNNIPQVNSFQWNQIHDRELQYVPLTFNLTDGTNTLEIANREDGAGLDKVFITKSEEVPSGFGLNDKSCSSNSSSGKSVVINPSILSPNPVVNNTRLSFEQPIQLIEIQVYDITGRLVHRYSGTETADQEAYLLNVNNLPAGTYYLKSLDTTGAFHQKQMVIKK